MIWTLILCFAVLAAGLVYFLSGRKTKARPAPAVAAPVNRRFWGKQLVVTDPGQACQSAKVLNGQCFAFGKVPALPLKDCDNTNCTCRFQDLVDRRATRERRTGQERREQIRFEDRKDRRINPDRRQGDHYDWQFTA